MLGKRLVSALAIAAALAGPALAQQPRGGSPHGGSPHGGGAAHVAPPAGDVPRGGGHFSHPGGSWASHPAWSGRGEFSHWRGGHWWTGNYGGRFGSWWIVGPDWYWYPSVVAPIPDPYTPPGMPSGYWYFCDAYQQYYPYVGACPSGWRAVAPY